jgi:hypothetical protein
VRGSLFKVMKNSAVDKEFAGCGSHVGMISTDQRARPSSAWTGHPLEFQRAGWATRQEGTFSFHVLFLNRVQFVPEGKSARDDQPNEHTVEEE